VFRLAFFRTTSGNEPVREWLKTLSPGERHVIGTDLRTVQLGFPLGMPLCRALGNGLHEVRSTLPTKKEARVIFFQAGTDLIAVHGFVKKTQATPPAALQLARKRKDEFEQAEKQRLKRTGSSTPPFRNR
jgi:phage-related protein